MDRFTNAFEALLAALADAVKQLGEGSQQPWARTRVEEAKQDFVNCCDVMCFQLKQAVEMIRQEMLHQVAVASPAGMTSPAATMDAEQVRQVLRLAEAFAVQLRDPAAAATAAASASGDAALAAAAGPAVTTAAASTPASVVMLEPADPAPYAMVAQPPAAAAPAPSMLQTAAAHPAGAAAAVPGAAVGVMGYPQPPQQQQQQQYPHGMGGYNAYTTS